MDSSFEAVLRAGIAIFNEKRYHAAHDAWEDRWLELEQGTPDEVFLHGLIQYTAAVYHLKQGNTAGAKGLAESGRGYLDALPQTYRGVSLEPLRESMRTIEADPTAVNPEEISLITHDGSQVTLEELDREARWVVAIVLAETSGDWSKAVIQRAIDQARSEEPGGRFRRLLSDFVCDDTHRSLIYDRLSRHLQREEAKSADVEGLFDGQGDETE